MAGRGVLDWERSWGLVSANPARAAGLADRGRIAPGARADAALLDPESGEVVATVAAAAWWAARPLVRRLLGHDLSDSAPGRHNT